ncbi:sugar ABC transporter permease [Leucobacter sp. L43]|uniref:sugar ABC transporter permease n=1 Tax=Leucobacter sp. L43 TaxID=2798040 RepID=UPI0019031284|nr:ribose ABC transporter permease [Leucobacter sp. L43]
MSSSATRTRFTFDWRENTSLIGLALVVAAAAVLSPTFFTSPNLMNLLVQVSSLGILAVGMTFVILTAGIDLSVGSLLALIGVIVAMVANHFGVWSGLGAALALGLLVGWFHGTTITKLKVPAFIVTLAGLTAYRGLAYVITGSAAVPAQDELFFVIGYGRVPALAVAVAAGIVATMMVIQLVRAARSGVRPKYFAAALGIVFMLGFAAFTFTTNGLPVPVIMMLVVFAAGWFVLNRTTFGRQTYAIGGNIEAARLAGIRVDRNLVIIYASLGLLVSLAAIITTSRLGSGAPSVGNLAELDAIAAVIIGGTSFAGGVGRLGGTAIGVLLIGVINNVLSLLNVTSNMQMIVKGLIIFIAVALDSKVRKR